MMTTKQLGADFGTQLTSAGLQDGVSWMDGTLYFSDDVTQEHRDAVQAIYDAYDPLVSMRAEQLAVINAAAQNEINAYIATYPDFERLTWATQEAESTAWQSADTGDQAAPLVPWCASAAQARGIELSEFMAKVAAKVAAFKAVSSAVAGKRQGYEDAINAATTADQITAIKWLPT